MQFPKLSQSTIVPESLIIKELEESKKKDETRKQHIHDYKIALLGIIGGGIMGLITSIIFWLITEQC